MRFVPSMTLNAQGTMPRNAGGACAASDMIASINSRATCVG
jgi:hypothetical protein